MGAGQYLKDFRRAYKIKKAAAHRHAVMQRKEKTREKSQKVLIAYMEQDSSPGKKTSHARLLAFLSEFKEAGLVNAYTKKELTMICKAYNIPVRASWVKKKMVSELAKSILANNNIPSHQLLNNYHIVPADNSQVTPNTLPVIRLRRV